VVTTEATLDGRRGEIEGQLDRLPGVRGLSQELTEGGGLEWTILCEDTAARPVPWRGKFAARCRVRAAQVRLG
jgi:hypothetical protein